MARAFRYYQDYFGAGKFVMLESEYPYTSYPEGAPSTKCSYSASKATNIKVKSIQS